MIFISHSGKALREYLNIDTNDYFKIHLPSILVLCYRVFCCKLVNTSVRTVHKYH